MQLVKALLLGHFAGRVVGSRWDHGWATAGAATFADFNPNFLLTDTQASFVASHYRILSLEKCTGIQSGVKTEAAIYATAKQLKAKDPSLRAMFYHATDHPHPCYAAHEEFMAHPEWHLKLDNGSTYIGGGYPMLDCTNAAARAWWVSIPLKGDGNGTYNGEPVADLIDGVLADNEGWSNVEGVSIDRLEALADAKRQMVGELQAKFTAANKGVVMANGISMYGGVNADPRYVDKPGGHNLIALDTTDAIMNEHTAVFEQVDPHNASFKLDLVSQNLDAIVTAAAYNNSSKVVFVQTWPGLYAGTQFTPTSTGPAHVYPSGGEPTPQNNDEWRDALRNHFAFAQALFLSVAEPNVYWMYGGYWYNGNTGYIACPEDLSSCPAPPEWYPDLNKPLGAPLAKRKLVAPYIWMREFEHATVHLDLVRPNASRVVYHVDLLDIVA